MAHIITVLATGFEETEAVVVIDLLRRAKIRVSVLGLDAREVRGAHDITIATDALFSEFNEPFDGIVLPGGMPGTGNLANSPRLLAMLRETHTRGGLCAAICAAPMVLARAGVLRGIRAACYPGMEKELAGAIVSQDPVVRDKNIVTSRGVGTTIPFALELISYLVNKDAAEKIAAVIVYQK